METTSIATMTTGPNVLATNLEVRLKKEFPEDHYLVAVSVASDAGVEVLVKNYDTKWHHGKAFEAEELDFDAIVREFEQAVWSP